MKKYLLVFILYCLYFQNVIAQQNHFLINTPQSGNITNVACKSIKLGPGYKYTAQSGQSMRTYIDPNMLCDISYGGGYTSTTTTIPPLNTSSEVGSIPGSFAVGSSGAAIYNVPLNLPPGTNGIMPQLSIVYNSQGGDGWLGQGWQLTGFSAITRTFKNVYLDGRAGGIDFTNGDAFALDGQRLFALIGQNGGDGTQYGTEVENFSSIKSYGNILANPVYWQVKTKEGTIMEYGNTTDSYIEAGNNLVAWMWLLNKVQDVNANYYSIHYIENKNGDTIEYRPDYIEYTGNTNTGLAPYVKIKFIYNKRSDVTYNIIHKGSLNYKTPVILKNSVLLTEIQVLVNNVLQKRYELNYFLSPIGNSRLYEIKEQGSDGKYLNSTKFVWSPIMNKNTIEYMSFSSNSNDYLGKHVSYDFNNDGYDDVAKIANNNIIIFNNPKNGQSFNVNNYIPFPRDTLNNTITFSSKLQERGDFDGDGKEDLLIIEMGTNHRVWLLSGLQIKGPYTITNLNQTTNFLPLKYVVGDFDGNGTKEVFFFCYPNNTQRKVEVYSLSFINNFNSQKVNISINDSSFFSNVYAINGESINADIDSKNELLLSISYSNFTRIFKYDEQNNALYSVSNLGYPSFYHKIYKGDFNGDGITDLLTWSGNYCTNGIWEVALGNGKYEFNLLNSFNHPSLLPSPNGNPDNCGTTNCSSTPQMVCHQYMVIDLNVDGKDDILDLSSNFTANNLPSYLEIFYSNGHSFTKIWQNTINIVSTYPSGVTLAFKTIGDFNGDGIIDLVFEQAPNSSNWFVYRPAYAADKITDIYDGNNYHTQIAYQSLAELAKASRYFHGSIPYPLYSLTGGLHVVSEVKEWNGNLSPSSSTLSPLSHILYTYFDALVHLQGKGFLGFLSTFKYDVISNTLERSFNNLPSSSNFFSLLPQKTEFYHYSSNALQLLKETQVDNYTFITGNNLPNGDPSGKRFFVYASQTSNKDYLTNFQTITYSNLDNYGNPIYQKTEYFDNYSLVETNEMVNTYLALCFPYPNKISSSITTKTRIGQSPYIRSLTYQYYPSSQNCLLKSITDDKAVTTEYQYNVFGNIISTQISGPTIGNNYITQHIQFDSKARFPIQQTNALGHTTEFTYDDYGNLLSEKDPNGLITQYQYDGFNRKIKTILPSGYIQTITRQWEINNSNLNNPLYSITYDSPQNAAYSKEYYNIRRQLVRTETPSFDGSLLFKDRSYNDLGLIIEETQPYQAGTSPSLIPKTNYFYDHLWRIDHIYHAGGGYTEYQYNGKTTTTKFGYNPTNIIRSSSQTIDPTGKIISSTDPSGTVSYTYHSCGKSTFIQTSDNHTISLQYDNFGRQTQLLDPNAGLMTYTYDELDRLISQTDAQNHTYTITYDPLHRVLSKTGPEGTTLYQYDASPHSKGKPTSITNFNGITTQFTYDALGRLSQKTETIQNQSYTYFYQYDIQNRITQLTFPSGFSLQYQYNALNHSTKILHGTTNTPLWEVVSRNPHNQITEDIGLGLWHTQFFYNSIGLPIGQNTYLSYSKNYAISYNIDAATLNTTSKIQVYYPTGGLFNGLQDNYQYDNQDQLINIQTQKGYFTNSGIVYFPQSNYSIQYHPNGNIFHKDGVGDYVYDPIKKHAVIRIDNPDPSLLNQPTQNISYTAFLQPDKITEANYELQYTYGYDHQRRISELKYNQTLVKKIVYQDNYEEISTGTLTYSVHYVYSPDRLAALVMRYDSAGTLYERILGVITDRQGSILALYNTNGDVVWQTSYDAWGRERNVTDGGYLNITPRPAWFIRGYTGHEHLPEFGLINMNGRMYDPVLGRMLSPDNYVQDATSVMGFNRYVYVRNNPLKYTDPEGEVAILDDVLAIVIGGAVNVAVNWKYITAGGKFDWGKAALFFGVGALAGEAALYTAGAVSGLFTSSANAVIVGAVSGAASGAVGGFITGSGNAWIQGANFQQGLKQGGIGAGIGAVTGAVAGAAFGWFSTTKAGQQFAKWYSQHSKGLLFDRSNPYSPFYNNQGSQNYYIEVEGYTVEFPGGNVYDEEGNLIFGKDNWSINHKGDIDSYLSKKGWTIEEIQETLNFGKVMPYEGTNYINPENPVIRIHNVILDKSLIYDLVAKQVIQLGKPGYLWK